ncbi:MAG TPA: hypothetical protein VGK90_08135 [Rhizomicrobium sp.]|jgi:hypothetical protein
MRFGKTLLGGVALCALATAPALAAKAPNFHLGGMVSRAITMHSGATHTKTTIRDPKYTNLTSTVTFTGTISEAGYYKNPVLLWSEAWFYGSCGGEVPNEKGKTIVQGTAGRVKAGTVTGNSSSCNGDFTFYGPLYDLKSKTATSDSFTFDVDAKATKSLYKLFLVGHTNLHID